MLLVAFSIKAAVFPLSFWLPDSYPTAPAPVTAVFAGLLTKVGVYALIRTETQLFSDSDVNLLLMIVALATMIIGVLGAVAQAELNAATAKEALYLAQERYRVGAGAYLDVSQAQDQYNTAQTDYINAVYQYHSAFATLESAVGRPLR